jgi:hypothetical protein
MPFEFFIYNHSNDGQTAAIRAHQDTVRQLAAACTGGDENVPGRTLTQYIVEADAAITNPESFFREVDILWQRPGPALPHRFATGRRMRVTYSGNVRAGGGIAFEGYCVVDPAWFAALLPLAPTPIQVEYITGVDRDLIIVLP